MLESQHAGYRSQEHNQAAITRGHEVEKFERVVRAILIFCFMAVLGLELWLLVSVMGSG